MSYLPANAAVDTRNSLSTQVYDLLRELIVSLWFKPGEPISEKLIAQQLKISRTPVREAIMRLADERLLAVYPQSGTIVSPIKLEDVYEGQIVREALELALIRRAVPGFDADFDHRFTAILERQKDCARWNDYNGFAPFDEEFHRLIAECGGAPRIWRIVSGAKAQLDRVRRLGLPKPGQLDRLIREHTAILEGLRAKDEERAVQALKAHLDAVLITIHQRIEQHADLFSAQSSSSSGQAGRRPSRRIASGQRKASQREQDSEALK